MTPDLRSITRKLVPAPHRPKVQRVLAGLRPGNLTYVGRVYGTDKASPTLGYTAIYQDLLTARRRRPVVLLEIGVGGACANEGGASLRMWRTFFPHGKIYGVDVMPKQIAEPRIEVFQGDQSDPHFLGGLGRQVGPFDVIVDDGSHRGPDVWASYRILLPFLRSGGMYVIENVETAYWTEYGGGPPGSDLNAAALAKRAVDLVNLRAFRSSVGFEMTPGEDDLRAVHVFDGLIVLEKRPLRDRRPDWDRTRRNPGRVTLSSDEAAARTG